MEATLGGEPSATVYFSESDQEVKDASKLSQEKECRDNLDLDYQRGGEKVTEVGKKTLED